MAVFDAFEIEQGFMYEVNLCGLQTNWPCYISINLSSVYMDIGWNRSSVLLACRKDN